MSAMDFTVEDQSGQGSVVDENHIASQLKSMGYPVSGVSADGMTFTFNDPNQGQYSVKTQDVLKEMGWNVKGMTPSNPDYENIQLPWRAAIHSLGQDEDAKKAYIEAKMKRSGVQEPQVVGQGRDWYVFNPNTSQWIAATNHPDWDMSDLVEAGMELPRLAGSAMGATAGGALGATGGLPGVIAGGALGGGVGGGLVEGAERYLQAKLDPEFGAIQSRFGGSQAEEFAKNAALDAVSGGIGGGLARKGPAAIKALMKAGPVSRMSQTAGSLAEGMGSATSALSKKAMQTPWMQDLLGMAAPGPLGTADVAGWTMQAPAAAVRGASKLFGQAVEQPELESMLSPETMNRLRNVAGGMFSKQQPTMTSKLGSLMGGESTARRPLADITENLAKGIKGQFGELPPEWQQAMGEARAAGPGYVNQFGIQGPEAEEMGRDIGEESARNMERYVRQNVLGAGAQPGARMVGQGLEGLESLGKLMQVPATAFTKGSLYGAYGAGQAGRMGGAALRGAGEALGPLESRGLLRYGGLQPAAEEAQRYWRRKHPQAIMDDNTILAAQ